jgi:hypothetical protein
MTHLDSAWEVGREQLGKENRAMKLVVSKPSSWCVRILRRGGTVAIISAVMIFSPQVSRAQTETIVPGTTSPNGFALPGGVSAVSSGFFAEIGVLDEESWISLNEDYVGLSAPCDFGCLRLWDQDGYVEVFSISNSTFSWSPGNTGAKSLNVDSDDDFNIRVGGEFFNIFLDPDADTAQSDVMRIYVNGSALTDRIFQMDFSGNVEIDGVLTENFAFDLAEAFWMSEPLTAGEVVAVDPMRPNAVTRATGHQDRGVLGVVSTRPGIVMGGGAFSESDLERNWGSEVTAQFRAEREVLKAKALAQSDVLQKLQLKVQTQKTAGAGSLKPEDEERLKIAAAEEELRLKQELEAAALDLFFEEHFVQIALAGRVPVKVEPGSVIGVGDYLAASAVPGLAAKATGEGPVIGIALEEHLGDGGEIMMFVQRGWVGQTESRESVTASHSDELDRLRTENARLEERIIALEAAVRRVLPETRMAQAQILE